MSQKIDLGSVITAMITPFNEKGAVDYNEACRLAVWLCENGSDTILLAGTTGESPTLTHDEEKILFTEVKKALGKKGKVMAGAGSNCTKTAVEATQAAEKIGVDCVLQVVPYYNKPSQEGMYQHFKTIAESTLLPIVLYNIPGRTGVNMLPETTARLAEIDNIIALKAACGNLEQIKKTKKICPKDFEIYSGDDGLTLDIVKIGGEGVISVASHLVGKQIKRMINAVEEEKMDEAEAINKELAEIFKILFITTNPSPVKYATSLLGFKVGKPRLPLVEPTIEEKAKIKKAMQDLKLI
ncbi:MAG: 4-hydroxy-tetrahydrodipicolinate synthase [Candidatus Margulisbacteria bacterium]|nr:4-hydroxy-tetrahydrodipicolinate synthase [Candidatus Margulisiibacteriota bacterium]